MKEKIISRLREEEARHGFRILYACESGSRAWGFASADSDYDVRFIFAWPEERYLSVTEPTQTLDYGIDEDLIDLSGWELRKSLRLFRNTNGALFEWLHSPIVYFSKDSVLKEWRDLAAEYFVPANSLAHYLGMSGGSWERIAESDETTAKKYLYTLRSILAGRFVVEKKRPIPVPFAELCDDVLFNVEVKEAIDTMISCKAGGAEGDLIPRIPVLDDFIISERASLADSLGELERSEVPAAPLDDFFRRIISDDE